MTTSNELTKEAAIHMIPVMQAQGLELMEQLMDLYHPKTFLEIGTAIGRTALFAAEKGATVTTIEKNPDMYEQAKQNILQSQYADQIKLLQGDALEQDLTGPFDLIFIDGAKSQYRAFFVKYAPLLSDNGIIISDNMKFHGLVDHPERTHNRHTKRLLRHLREYREFLEHQQNFHTVFLDQTGDGLAITRRIQ